MICLFWMQFWRKTARRLQLFLHWGLFRNLGNVRILSNAFAPGRHIFLKLYIWNHPLCVQNTLLAGGEIFHPPRSCSTSISSSAPGNSSWMWETSCLCWWRCVQCFCLCLKMAEETFFSLCSLHGWIIWSFPCWAAKTLVLLVFTV